MCCQVEVSAFVLSLVQGSPTVCGLSECDREAALRGGDDPESDPSATGNKRRHVEHRVS